MYPHKYEQYSSFIEYVLNRVNLKESYYNAGHIYT